MPLKNTGLPIETILDSIRHALASHDSLLISAEPGAGKTTVVPPSLLEEPWLAGKKILMLEPRRLAARTAAKRMAFLLGEEPGRTVGYRTRLESCVSRETRIEVVTEAILTRMIQADPALEGVGLLIFDEFHERGIHADLGLALALDSRSALNENLKIILMSATLDSERIASLLGDCPVIRAPGRCFDVRVFYSGDSPDCPLEQRIAGIVLSALMSFPGDILAFLPGEYEIRAAMLALTRSPALPGNAVVYPLYGNLSPGEQDRALAPAGNDVRKVILATSIAETSITVEGVRIVIDSCRMRVQRFSPRNGLNRLETLRVSKASAEQRRGRAGRVSEGVCIRLCTEFEFGSFDDYNTPEILECDLAPLALELAKWGVTPDSVASLKWLDAPPEAALKRAFELLTELGAVSESYRLTKHGERMLRFPLHPRLSHMVLKSEEFGASRTAAAIAAIVSERDFLRMDSTDLRKRLEALDSMPATADRGTLERIRKNVRQILDFIPGKASKHGIESAGLLIALAYPDRVARWRNPHSGEYALANGICARLRKGDDLSASEYLAVAASEGVSANASIYLAAPLNLDEFERICPCCFSQMDILEWDPERKAVCIETRKHLGSLVISRTTSRKKISGAEILPVFLNGVRKHGMSAWSLSDSEKVFLQRVAFLHRFLPDSYPDVSEQMLMDSLETWLAPFVDGFTRLEDLRKLNFHSVFQSMLETRDLIRLDLLAPERVEVPSGSRIRVDYSNPEQPQLSVRLQELFGMMETPRLAGGRVPLLMDILSPAMRTVQKSADLKSFWNESYFLVRKDMRGRYPKHDWPENPLDAIASRGAKRKKSNS